MEEVIRERLTMELQPTALEIINDSAKHIGHPGSRDGAGHYTVKIASPHFDNLSRVKSHQKVYQALADFIPDKIHALRIIIIASPSR